MIWEEPTFKDSRSLQEWIEGIPLPIGIEKHAAEKKLPKQVENVLQGVLLIADERKSVDVVAGVLNALKDHADEIACFTTSQVLRGLSRLPKWKGPDEAVEIIEVPDVLIIYGTKHMTPNEERVLDRALAARGFRPPRVTVLIGNPSAFTHVRDAYGEERTYEFRGKAPKKGAER